MREVIAHDHDASAVDPPEVRHRLAGAIYGQIVATATTLSLADADLAASALLAGVVGTMLVFWIAHSYAEILADRSGRTGRLGLRGALFHLRQEWSIVQAAAPAVVALGPAALGLWSRDTGVTVTVVLGIGSLCAWGLFIARRTGASWLLSVGASVLSGGLGLVIVALEVAIH